MNGAERNAAGQDVVYLRLWETARHPVPCLAWLAPLFALGLPRCRARSVQAVRPGHRAEFVACGCTRPAAFISARIANARCRAARWKIKPSMSFTVFPALDSEHRDAPALPSFPRRIRRLTLPCCGSISSPPVSLRCPRCPTAAGLRLGSAPFRPHQHAPVPAGLGRSARPLAALPGRIRGWSRLPCLSARREEVLPKT